MATVEEIARRIVRESGSGPDTTPWLTREQREKRKSWVPNRKVVAGLVTGAISWASFKYFGISDLDPEVENGLTVLVMGLISYLVPLKDS